MTEKETAGIETTDTIVDNAFVQMEEVISSSIHAYEGKEPFVFISYSHQNTDEVLRLLEQLGKSGLRYWYDDGIEWGSEWPQSIAEHLKRSSLLIAFHSKTSIKSQNCRQEIAYAIKHKKTILSVYLDDVVLPEGLDMQLSIYQALYAKTEKELEKCILENQYVKGCIDQEKYKRHLIEKEVEEVASPNTMRKSWVWGIILVAAMMILFFLGQRVYQNRYTESQASQDELESVREQLSRDLDAAFPGKDEDIWINPENLSLVISSGRLFDPDKTELNSEGKKLLKEYLPKYFSILLKPEYKDHIQEIVIKAHTDSNGTYMHNLELSQDRALAVTIFCLKDEDINLSKKNKVLLRKLLKSIGEADNELIYMENGKIDEKRSRRIECSAIWE